MKLGKLKDEVVFRDRKLCKLVGMRKVARKARKKMRSRITAVLSNVTP